MVSEQTSAGLKTKTHINTVWTEQYTLSDYFKMARRNKFLKIRSEFENIKPALIKFYKQEYE